MTEGNRDSIRAVERAIDLIQALNARPVSTLHELHRDTGLPKPSIVRLLRTLEGKGLVAQASSYGGYQLLDRIKSLSSGFHHEPLIVQFAEQILIEFTRREGWPLALALFDRDAMVVRSSTIPYTTLSLFHSHINKRLSMVHSAMGLAYLAHCSPSEQTIILEILKRSDDPIADPAGYGASCKTVRSWDPADALRSAIDQVRERGYATLDSMIDPRAATLAVPLMDSNRVVASLGMTWIAVAMPLARAVDVYLPKLTETAAAISRELANRQPDQIDLAAQLAHLQQVRPW